MSVRVRCPHPDWGKKYKVAEDQLGFERPPQKDEFGGPLPVGREGQ